MLTVGQHYFLPKYKKIDILLWFGVKCRSKFTSDNYAKKTLPSRKNRKRS